MPWPLPRDEAELLALAKTYPYAAPAGSYLFAEGRVVPLTGAADERRLFAERFPVIAHGSNRAPAQLARKFGGAARIPVTVGWLRDYDVVYSAHMTRYGAIASTLHYAPGVRARLSLTWLSGAQLLRMHETEGFEHYSFGWLRRIELDLEIGPESAVTEVSVYLSTYGCLTRAGGPIGLAVVEAAGRSREPLHQEAALELVRHRHRPHMTLDHMILDAIRAAPRRRALVRDMRARALARDAPHFDAEP